MPAVTVAADVPVATRWADMRWVVTPIFAVRVDMLVGVTLVPDTVVVTVMAAAMDATAIPMATMAAATIQEQLSLAA
jgi:hypothetical protein